jgi:hypothetical protein
MDAGRRRFNLVLEELPSCRPVWVRLRLVLKDLLRKQQFRVVLGRRHLDLSARGTVGFDPPGPRASPDQPAPARGQDASAGAPRKPSRGAPALR